MCTTKVYELTRAPALARLADLLREDYPTPAVSGVVRFSAGTHIGYQFNAAGQITAQKSLFLSRTSAANTDLRIRVQGRGLYYRITNGTLAGYLASAVPGQRVLLGAVVPHTYAPPRKLAFNPGTYTGYRYDAGWAVAAKKTFTFTRSSAAPFGATAWVNGRLSYQITGGVYAGYWLPAAAGLVPA
ncbi:hypothetical protein [Micromonospora sonchi]|uniref:hypothetical protein n=1 Tax=Micromonospora sonchi TaxID=1763543 RepID=UPI001E3F06AD|nr:hypothetical protein [Micromonospora sonchi]